MIYQIQFSGKVVVNSLTSIIQHKSMTTRNLVGLFMAPGALVYGSRGHKMD